MIYEIIQHRVLVIDQQRVLLMLGWNTSQHNTMIEVLNTASKPNRTRKLDDD